MYHTDYPADAGDRAAAILRHPGQDPSEVRQLERLQAAARTPLRVQLAKKAPDGKVPHPGGTHRQEVCRTQVQNINKITLLATCDHVFGRQ